MYLKQDNDKIVFPYTRKDLEVENPNVSFPHTIPDSLFLQYGVYPVVLIENTLNSNEVDGVLGQPYSENGRWEVKPTIITLSKEEYELRQTRMYADCVQTHIEKICQSLGYDNENSIAKYLVAENPFYTECKAISLWIGAVWTYANKVQTDVLAGTRTMPTIEELVAELPKYV